MSDPPSASLTWLVPFVRGRTYNDYLTHGFSGLRNWFGSAVFLVGLAGLSSPPRRRQHGVWFFAIVAVLLILKIYGTPLVNDVGKLPLLNTFQFPTFGAPVVGFATAVLAAIGMEAISERSVNQRIFGGALAASGVLVTVLAVRNGRRLMATPTGSLVREGLVVAAVISAIVLSVWLLPRRGARWAIAIAITFELMLLTPRGFYEARSNPWRAPGWTSVAATSSSDRIYGLDGQLYPNTGSVFGYQDVRALDAIYVQRYMTYVDMFLQPGAATRFTGTRLDNPEEPSGGHIAGNPMFNLLGVRWVVAEASQPSDDVLPRVLNGGSARATSAQVVDISGDRRLALVERPGDSIAVPLVEETPLSITFEYGSPTGSSVAGPLSFEVDGVNTSGVTTPLWDHGYSPSDSAHRAWQSGGFTVPPNVQRLVLRVTSRGSGRPSVGAWTSFSLGPDQYRLIGQWGLTALYENEQRDPRAFVVHDVKSVRDISAAKRWFFTHGTRMPDGGLHMMSFDPRRQAVVESSRSITGASCAGASDSANILSYESTRVMIEVKTSCPGLLVLTDTFYPGWKASVDHHATAVMPTDLAFRGVPVPAGESEVVLTFRSAPLRAGVIVAATALAIVAGLAIFEAKRRSGYPPEPDNPS